MDVHDGPYQGIMMGCRFLSDAECSGTPHTCTSASRIVQWATEQIPSISCIICFKEKAVYHVIMHHLCSEQQVCFPICFGSRNFTGRDTVPRYRIIHKKYLRRVSRGLSGSVVSSPCLDHPLSVVMAGSTSLTAPYIRYCLRYRTPRYER